MAQDLSSRRGSDEQRKHSRHYCNADLKKTHEELGWEGSHQEYLDLVVKDPAAPNLIPTTLRLDRVLRLRDPHRIQEKIVHWSSLTNSPTREKMLFTGSTFLDETRQRHQSGTLRYGTEKRVILLHVGRSAKSTIVRMLKRLEYYTKQPEVLYIVTIERSQEILKMEDHFTCPINEEPFTC